MHVVHVGNDPSGAGGIASVIRQHLKRNWAVHVENLISYDQDATARWARQRPVLSAAWRLARLRRGPELIVHFHLSQRGSWLREGGLMWLARAMGLRHLVVTLHGSSVLHLGDRGRRVLARVLKPADVVHVLSHTHEEALRSVGQVVVLPNDVDVVVEPLAMSRRDPVVVFAGEIGLRKGVDVLLQAWDRLCPTGWALHLFGRRTPPFDSLGPERPEVVIEELLHVDVLAAMSSAAVFVLPSRAEAFPMSLCEAMAAGCAVVATNVGAASELMGSGSDFVVAPGDVDALTTALDALVHDADLRRVQGEHNHGRARGLLSSELVTPRWESLYRELVLAKAGKRRVRS